MVMVYNNDSIMKISISKGDHSLYDQIKKLIKKVLLISGDTKLLYKQS